MKPWHPHFMAFYSYRGGVGRTTALCNVAARMALQGDRVLVVDLDLQAPGASIILGAGKHTVSPGLAEEIVAIKDKTRELDLAQCVRTMRIGKQLFWLLPAGRLDATYPERVERADPTDWLARDEPAGIKFFQDLRRAIETSEERWHYVLIDCRPGLTRAGALAASTLAESVVVLIGLSRQSLAGIGWVRQNFEIEDKAVHLVASQIIDDERMSAAIEEANRAWEEPIKVMLHFEPSMLLNERILFGPEGKQQVGKQLAQDYDELTRVVRKSGDVYSLIEQGKRLLSEPGQIALAHSRFADAIQQDSTDPRALTAMANYYLVQGQYAPSMDYLEKSATKELNSADLWQVADALSEKAPNTLSSRLDALYSRAPESAASSIRVILARFSVQIRNALESDPDNANGEITRTLVEVAKHAGSNQQRWQEFVRRVPFPATPAEERQAVSLWIRIATAGGPPLQPLLSLLKERSWSQCADVSGTVARFGAQNFGFLATDDGQSGIYFTRDDCANYGSEETDYISIGETAIFDMEVAPDGTNWIAKNVRFPAKE